jgi:hypothetical protein|tara:strand:- start:2299 stop:2814 length:516 start_codon:yes stop_codon:yes gene_type:complete
MPDDTQREPPLLTECPPTLPPKRKGWWKVLPALVIALVIAAVIFISQYEPVANKQYYPQCGFKKATGYDCPGCGGLRATHAITRGNIAGAFHFHPGFVLSLPIVGYLLVLWIREWRRTSEMPFPLTQPECNRPLTWIAILFVSLGILRNIPVKPFTWLATPPIEAKNPDSN